MLFGERHAVTDTALRMRSTLRPRCSIDGVALPLDSRLSLGLRRTLLEGNYERNEMDIVRETLEPHDRVLECGAGLGLLAAYCAQRLGNERVKAFEANPHLADLIRRTFAMNRVAPQLVIGAVGAYSGETRFHVRRNFWASSAHEGRAEGSLSTLTVPQHGLDDEVRAHAPTYVFLEIEGAEGQLADCSELPGVHKVMVEIHPELIGRHGVAEFVGWLERLGFVQDADVSKERELFFARRVPTT